MEAQLLIKGNCARQISSDVLVWPADVPDLDVGVLDGVNEDSLMVTQFITTLALMQVILKPELDPI